MRASSEYLADRVYSGLVDIAANSSAVEALVHGLAGVADVVSHQLGTREYVPLPAAGAVLLLVGIFRGCRSPALLAH